MPSFHIAQVRYALHYLDVAEEANSNYKCGGENLRLGLAQFDQNWINIRSAQAWARNNVRNDNWAAAICNNFPNAAAEILCLRQHPQEQLRWRETALEIARRFGERTAEAAHLGSIGNAYNSLGDFRQAVERFSEALAITREVKNKNMEGSALINLGLATMYLGETRQAIEHCKQALVIFREIGDRRAQGGTFGHLGLAYKRLGDFQYAINLHEQQLEIARETGDRSGEGSALNNLGNLYRVLGDVRRAINCHQGKLVVAREMKDHLGEGITLGNLGNDYSTLETKFLNALHVPCRHAERTSGTEPSRLRLPESDDH